MTDQVVLSVKGLQFADHEMSEPLEMMTIADYYFRNGTHFLLYEEPLEGTTEKIKNILKIKKGHAEITRKGALNTDMVFEEGQRIGAHYETPYGKLTLTIRTDKIVMEESEDKIYVKLVYTVESEGEYISDNEVEIKIISRDSVKRFDFR